MATVKHKAVRALEVILLLFMLWEAFGGSLQDPRSPAFLGFTTPISNAVFVGTRPVFALASEHFFWVSKQ
jgi:hypothetical protein